MSTLTLRTTPDISLEISVCVVGWMVPVAVTLTVRLERAGLYRFVSDRIGGILRALIPPGAGKDDGNSKGKPKQAPQPALRPRPPAKAENAFYFLLVR